ncbi:hypothetical protein ACWEKM_43260 [Streptomyces sp. NPDC004752]
MAPVPAWHLDQAVLDAQAAVDGWYALPTSVPAGQATSAGALVHYKGQGTVEPATTVSRGRSRSRRSSCSLRIGDVTGPLTVQITRGVQLHLLLDLLHLLDPGITRTRWP